MAIPRPGKGSTAQKFISLVTVFASLVPLVNVSHAQTLEEEIKSKRKQLLESANSAPFKEAHIAHKKAANKVNALEQSMAATQSEQRKEEDPAKKIIGHYRGSEGVPLPDPKTLPQSTIARSALTPVITSNVRK